MIRSTLMITVLLVFLSVAAARAETVGPAVEVAPQAQGSRQQIWAGAAWCEGAKCWLVAWREGFLNEEASQIVCARISSDGKALDPAGIVLTSGKGLKDQPRVASDGKGFLVVWEDMRNGKDWDVYAVRVSGDGKALDKDSVLVSGGEGNQCRPDVIFAKGNYLAAWMSFKNGYGVYMTRVSPAGQVLDAAGLELCAFNKGYGMQATFPVLATDGENVLATYHPTKIGYNGNEVTLVTVDAATGRASGERIRFKPDRAEDARRPQAVALGREGAMTAVNTEDVVKNFRVVAMDKSGKVTGTAQKLFAHTRNNFAPNLRMVATGKDFLLVSDYAAPVGKDQEKARIQIRGWKIAADGKVLSDENAGFEIAADAAKDQMLPAVAAGPDGSVLVVYSELRGVDDVKVMARIVK